jgi:glycosyltransferase involved in cell wall biosynthesis
MSLIAVDMTPALPGGTNGGAKIVAFEILKSLKEMAPEEQFLLLTASWNHEELAILDGPNMRRLCVARGQEPKPKPFTSRRFVRFQRGLRKGYRYLRRVLRSYFTVGNPLTERGVALLFCPFTAPTFSEPGIPVISVVHDMQHRDCPQFFSPHEIDLRDAYTRDVCQKADAIICVSEHARQSVLRHLKTPPEKTYAVRNCVHNRLKKLNDEEVRPHLADLGIEQRPYMFYPGNFWPHKNHRMLLTTYGMFLSRNPETHIDLVFTGALDDIQEELKCEVRRMGLAKRVHFLGFLAENQFRSVWQGCEFLIFPSLYEGFGIPVLEAMSFGKAVLCSNTTSLPEVGGDVALYFDPRKPKDIVESIERISRDPTLRSELTLRGYRHAADFRIEDMTRKYLEIFHALIENPKPLTMEITGVFEDGWTSEKIVITHNSGPPNRGLELQLEAPYWLPAGQVKLKLQSSDGTRRKWTIHRGKELAIRHPLPERQGHLTLSMTPTFRPSEHDMGEDSRMLGLLCRGCWVFSSEQERTSLL